MKSLLWLSALRSICIAFFLNGQCDGAILNSLPPAGGQQKATSELKRNARFLKAPRDEVSLSEPHPVYSVADLRDVARGQLLSKAHVFTWRYLILHKDEAIAEINLNADPKVGPLLSNSGFSEGFLSKATLAALEEAKNFPQIRAKDYQLRLLKLPRWHFTALWLQRESEDILIPLYDTPTNLKPNKAYSEDEVIKALKPLAERIIEGLKNAGPGAVG